MSTVYSLISRTAWEHFFYSSRNTYLMGMKLWPTQVLYDFDWRCSQRWRRPWGRRWLLGYSE